MGEEVDWDRLGKRERGRESRDIEERGREMDVDVMVFLLLLSVSYSVISAKLQLKRRGACCRKDKEREKMEKTKRIEERKYFGDQTLTEYTVEDGVEEIGEMVFYGCENLKKVTIPRGVRRIRGQAFACSGLTEVTLKEGVEKIGDYAFWDCSSLEQVVLVKGIRKIGNCAFSGDKKLTELEIREGVEEIGWGIVAGTSLHTITLPLHPIPQFHKLAFREFYEGPPLSSLTTLRLRGTYHASPLSIPFPRITERDNGQLVRFVRDQQKKRLRAELLVANTIFYTCFSLKCARTGLYNAYGSPVLARIFRFWFRGASLPFPIRGEKKIRAWALFFDGRQQSSSQI